MVNGIVSIVYLIVGAVIGLGAFGHGSAASKIHANVDPFPIVADTHTMLFVVWYFVSGCMLTFGLTIALSWYRLRSGDGSLLAATHLIGALYLGIGAFGWVYRNHDPFMVMFIVLGTLLLASGFLLQISLPAAFRAT